MGISDLIPTGKKQAISRPILVGRAIDFGIVSKDVVDPDRAVRQLIADARKNEVILFNPSGGYYKPDIASVEDMQELGKYIRTEDRRAISIFSHLKYAKQFYEDYKADRLEVKTLYEE